jgi:hypothetical protein
MAMLISLTVFIACTLDLYTAEDREGAQGSYQQPSCSARRRVLPPISPLSASPLPPTVYQASTD